MRSKKAVISIIIPIYKGQRFINKIIGMLENVRSNAKHYELEIMLVNDYPKEDIFIDTYLKGPIHLIKNKENLGIHKSRIEGLLYSTGEYILFLDKYI